MPSPIAGITFANIFSAGISPFSKQEAYTDTGCGFIWGQQAAESI